MSTARAQPVAPPPGAAPRDAHIVLRGVSMSFGGRRVIRDLDCAFPRGGISVILGGSGVGKSTVLRLIAGLVRPDAGQIVVDGTDVVGLGERALRPVREKIGMMFQAGALLDSTSVFDNVAFPLREHTRLDERAIADEVHAGLARMGLEHADALLPSELSGGMVKRVALARAMIGKPDVLLCDEPFSGLDPITARRIERLLARIHREQGTTMVMVSHDVGSTSRLADHLLVLLPEGHVEGTPESVRAHPDPRVANLLSLDVDPELTGEVDVEAAALRGGGAGGAGRLDGAEGADGAGGAARSGGAGGAGGAA